MSNNKIINKDLVDYFMYLDAKEFYKAALILKQTDDIGSNPYYTLMAFSIELFLKCICVTETVIPEGRAILTNVHKDHVQGHLLNKIFEELAEKEPKVAEALEKNYLKHYGFSLKDDLAINTSLFMDARYTYPKDGRPFGPKREYEYKPLFGNSPQKRYGIQIDIRALESVAEFLDGAVDDFFAIMTGQYRGSDW
ncbi:hypothetical protein [Vibrio sp. HN007]|uniref:hypothetical protein n=1 Tax=Vibrio iocasae TaxID=3098914 RepID=UPI0035D3EE7C